MEMIRSKVDLVNRSLLAIGEAPIEDTTVLDTVPLGTDIDVANRMVESTIYEVLNRGWFFNIDYYLPLYPDTGGFITLPTNMLRVDFGNTEYTHQYTLRNGKVYDMINHTFYIGKPLEADAIYYVEVEELPISAYNYIGARAARKFQEKVIGDTNMLKITMQEEKDALTDLQREDMQYQDYNMIRGSRIHNGYLIAGLYKTRGRR